MHKAQASSKIRLLDEGSQIGLADFTPHPRWDSPRLGRGGMGGELEVVRTSKADWATMGQLSRTVARSRPKAVEKDGNA